MGRWTMVLLLAGLGGCATLTGPEQQEVRVQTILDEREVAGAGCILSNDAGRWFVSAPGRVLVRRSSGKLTVECRKPGAASGRDVVSSRMGNSTLVGNIVVSAGLGYFIDKQTGAGFDYPPTITVILRATAPAVPEDAGTSGSVVY